MEWEHDIEDIKLGSCDSESETDEYRVEDHTELEDEESGHLGCKMFVIIRMGPAMSEMILTSWRVAEIIFSSWYTSIGNYSRCALADIHVVDSRICTIMPMATGCYIKVSNRTQSWPRHQFRISVLHELIRLQSPLHRRKGNSTYLSLK